MEEPNFLVLFLLFFFLFLLNPKEAEERALGRRRKLLLFLPPLPPRKQVQPLLLNREEPGLLPGGEALETDGHEQVRLSVQFVFEPRPPAAAPSGGGVWWWWWWCGQVQSAPC